MLRPSSYFNAVEIGDGNSLLYNGFSMCMDAVPSDIARRLVAYREDDDFSFLMPDEKEYLVKRGHLTSLTVADERVEMEKLARAIAGRNAELHGQPSGVRIVTFILTYQCNLSCAYCYQSEVREASNLSAMNEAFVDDFFHNHLDKIFPGTPKHRFRFLLFGGEPLLPANRGVIERILRYAGEHEIVVSTSTNAVMLPKMLDLIGPEMGKINNVQVTLDGGRMFHDEKRVSPSGAPTFEEIIFSVRRVVQSEAMAIIRIHLHPDRMESARALVEYLDREEILGHDNIEVYFAPLHSFHSQDISASDRGVFSRLFQYVALKQKKLPIQNFDFLQQIMNAKTTKNWSQPRYCSVSAGVHCAVDPHGDLYECLEEAGYEERRIGTISGGEIEYFKLRDVYKGRYLANLPECLQCSIALFCGGGCISRKRTQGDTFVEHFCRQNKVFVGETLKACYLLKQAGNSGTAVATIC